MRQHSPVRKVMHLPSNYRRVHPPPHTHDLADCNNEHSHLNPIIQSRLNVLIYSAFSLCLEIPGVNVTFLCIVPDFCSVLF